MKVLTPPKIEWPEIRVERRRQWPALVVTVAILLAAEGAARLAEPHLPPPLDWPTEEMQGKFEQISQLAEGAQRVDVAFVGSSVAFEGIDPVAFADASGGLVAYNAGIPAASLQEVEIWTSQIVMSRLRPRNLVIALTSQDGNHGSGVDFRDRFLSSRGFQRATQPGGENPANRLERLAEKHIALFRLRTVLRDPVKAFRWLALGDEAPELGPIGPYGQEPVGREDPDYNLTERVERDVREDLDDYAVGEAQLAALDHLVAHMHEEGVGVFLVLMPVTDDYLRLHPHGTADYAAFESAVRSLANRRGVPIVDLGTAVDSLQLFRDPAHLNPRGAEIASRMLAEELRDDL